MVTFASSIDAGTRTIGIGVPFPEGGDLHRHVQRMSWRIAFTVALLAAIITAVVTIPVADKVTRLHGVSDCEGGRGMAIVFVLIPAGFIGGFLFGLLGTRIAHATECAYFWKAVGPSILLGQLALFGIAAFSFVTMPRPLVLSD